MSIEKPPQALEKPLPLATPTSQPFWDALNDERVMIQRCDDCDAWVFYPRSHCSGCLSDQLSWQAVSGAGVLYTFTVSHQPTSPHFADEVPQLLAVVELDEGVRLTTTLVGVAVADIEIGMRVQPVFDHVDEAVTLLRYTKE